MPKTINFASFTNKTLSIMGYYKFYNLIFAALFCAFISCSNDPVSNNGDKTNTLKQTAEDVSLSLNEDLYNSFSSNITRTDLDEEDSYPTYFGGSYTSSKDSLVIFVKGMNKNGISDIYERIGKHPNLFFKSCTYSLNELNELKEYLDKYYFGNPTLRKRINWISTGINIEKNKIVVFLGTLSDKCITDFKKSIIDSPMITFEEMQLEEDLSYILADTIPSSNNTTRTTSSKTNIFLGSEFSCTYKNTTATGSVGFRATLGNDHGFITAAHCLPITGLSVYYKSKLCGTSSKTTLGPNAEAAFVKVNYALFYPTNVTQWTKSNMDRSNVFANSSLTNRNVTLEGATTKKAIEAKVTTINVSFEKIVKTVAGTYTVSLKKMVYAKLSNQSTSALPQSGDSGGIIYDKNTKMVCGELFGKGIMGGENYILFSSAELALNALGAKLY